MTAIGGRKFNATGRETGQRKVNRAGKIRGNWVPIPAEMLESPAYRVLSLSARRVLDRIGIEQCSHGGADNGRLPVTFQDFEDYGIDRHSILDAIKECEALGFIEITQRGRAGIGEFRKPNVFRLTYLTTPPKAATNEWRVFESIAEAKAAKQTAKLELEEGRMTRKALRASRTRKGVDIDSSVVLPTENTAA